MMNSNYCLHSCVILALFTNSASLMTSYDSYTDFFVNGVKFINFHERNHPMEYCKFKMGEDAIWIGYYDDVIPSDICNRHISCRANDVPDQEFIGVYPKIGVRCQRRSQNEYHNFGYGCYEGRCVPIICMDDNCRGLLNLNKDRKKLINWFFPDQRTFSEAPNWYQARQFTPSSVQKTHQQTSTRRTFFDNAVANFQTWYKLPHADSTDNIILFTDNRNSSEPVL